VKALSAGLIFVASSSIAGLLLGMAASGLSRSIAITSTLLGLISAIVAYLKTSDEAAVAQNPLTATPKAPSPRAKRVRKGIPEPVEPPAWNYKSIVLFLVVAVFAIFAIRSFCWILFLDGNELRIQSPNNLGDISLHIAQIKEFANGLPLWPDSPIYYASKLRYPAGIDLFNGLLLRLGVNLIPGLVWTGLLASAATCFAFYRWGRTFGIAGFLFNGGLVGWQFFNNFRFLDYQGDKTVAWKNLALSMFVTQRGLLYAIPAGLLLLCYWRDKYFAPDNSSPNARCLRLPFWVELALYASMPLFHIHTFFALSIVLAVIFVLGDSTVRMEAGSLAASSFVPATFLVWLVTDHFHAGSILEWKLGWVQTGNSDLAAPFFKFWLLNFGLWIPLVAFFLYICWKDLSRLIRKSNESLPASVTFTIPALFLFLLACLAKTAPWEWDNMKIIIWAYFLVLPFLWTEVIARWPLEVRAIVCLALFTSGFVSLVGGLAPEAKGYTLAERSEVDAVGVVVKRLGPNERFASYPTYNHPLLLQGRKVVLGYGGHLWTEGFNYQADEQKLTLLMNGALGWEAIARKFHARYLFWGPDEKLHYAASKHPWEKAETLVASGAWGAIYDLDSLTQPKPGH
jgi:hypothetical protein